MIDGASYHLIQQFLPDLHTFRELSSKGLWGKLESVYPALTPVALASMFTGYTPKNHGITGSKIFVKDRNISNPITAFSSTGLLRDPLWVQMARSGLKVLVTSAPQALPDKWELDNLVLLDPYKMKDRKCGEGKSLYPGEGDLYGNRVVFKRDDKNDRVSIGDQEISIERGGWSTPIEIDINCKLEKRQGLIYLFSAENSLYVSPPLFLEKDWANRDSAKVAVWDNVVKKTPVVLDGDYISLSRGIITFRDYISTVEAAFNFFLKYTKFLLENFPWDFSIVYLPVVDNLQHLLYGVDEGKEFIKTGYLMMDNFLKEVWFYSDILFLASDHGITSVSKRVFINTILKEANLLHVDGEGIDWSRTKAVYGSGGIIRVNLKGREGKGIVSMKEFKKLVMYISKVLEREIDQETGYPVFRSIIANESPAKDREGDIIVTPREGYSISSSLDSEVKMEKVQPFKNASGDHGYYRNTDMEGIYLLSIKNKDLGGKRLSRSLLDVAPTIGLFYNIHMPSEGTPINQIFYGSRLNYDYGGSGKK